MKLLLLDKDGTLVSPKSGEKFIQNPWDQKPLPGVREALRYYHENGWKMAICSNQAGVAAGHKTLLETNQEMIFCLELLPEIEEAYFCPDYDGGDCYRTWTDDFILYNSKSHSLVAELELNGTFRKPGNGMLTLAINIHGADECWYIGDRPEDEQAAASAGVNFLPADIWRSRFQPGLQEMSVNRAQLSFLEGIG